MRRALCLMTLSLLGVAALAIPAAAQSTHELKAEFHDKHADDCPAGTDECGKGHLKGFGTVTTTLTFTSFAPGPGPNCVTGTADRTVTLDADGSTLLLAVAGTICDQQISATFTVVGGSGIFAGAGGGGTFWGVAIPGTPADTVHYRGELVLP
jgi:hypothetical protein